MNNPLPASSEIKLRLTRIDCANGLSVGCPHSADQISNGALASAIRLRAYAALRTNMVKPKLINAIAIVFSAKLDGRDLWDGCGGVIPFVCLPQAWYSPGLRSLKR